MRERIEETFVQAVAMMRSPPPSLSWALRLLVLSGACLCGAAQGQLRSATAEAPGSASKPVEGQSKLSPQKATEVYLAGVKLLEKKRFADAQTAFAHASALDPTHREYAQAFELTRAHRVSEMIQQAAQARLTGATTRADSLLAEARAVDPHDEHVLEHMETAERSQAADAPKAPIDFAGPIQLEPNAGRQDLHLRGDIRPVLTQAASAFGIKAIFDDSVAGQQVRFDLEASPYAEAMPVLLRMGRLFAVPIDSKTLLVAKDSEENRQKFERQIEETVYVPGSTIEQLNELSNIVKNVFDVKQVVVSQNSGTLLIRAPEAALKALNYTLDDLIDGGAEVVLQLQLITIDKSRLRDTGVSPPTSLGAFSVLSEAQQIVTANQSLVDQAVSSGAFTPGTNPALNTILEALFLIQSGVANDPKVSGLIALIGNTKNPTLLAGLYLGSGATINLALNTSEARALDDISVRVGDHQTTTLRVGEKYPITTATYTSGISNAAATALAGRSIGGVPASTLLQQFGGAGSAGTVPLVQYEDLGITLKTTPNVHKSGTISLHVDLKLESLTGGSINNIPILTSRAFVSDITVEDGSSAVMVSDLDSTETASVSGLPGLGEIPGFRQSAADELVQVNSSELVLLITPHIVRHRSSVIASRQVIFNPSVPQEN